MGPSIFAAGVRQGLPQCVDRTAYATLLSFHANMSTRHTFLDQKAHRLRASQRFRQQIDLVLVLARSLRFLERCRRDFVLLLGDQVALLQRHVEIFQRERIVVHRVPPIFDGFPTADKLYAWNLVQYAKILMLDADVMAIRPIDDIFDHAEELTIAHHSYDHLQGQCGLPLQSRGVAAMFVLRPSAQTFASLLRFIKDRFKGDRLLYADQTGLACFFANRSRTLPAPYLYDLSNPLRVPGLAKWER